MPVERGLKYLSRTGNTLKMTDTAKTVASESVNLGKGNVRAFADNMGLLCRDSNFHCKRSVSSVASQVLTYRRLIRSCRRVHPFGVSGI